MTDETAPAKKPRPNLGPSRPALSPQTRRLFVLILSVALLTAVIVGALLAGSGGKKAPESIDQAIAAVGFHRVTEPGAGKQEDKPLPSPIPASAKDALAPGTKAPPFDLYTPRGKRISLASLRGKTVLLEFFATWCPHCHAEAPHLKALYATLDHKRYAFVAVNGDGEDPASVLAYHRFFELPFPALLDPNPSDPGSFKHEGSRGPVSLAYKLSLFPTFYVLDPRGRVVWAGTGEQPDALLLHQLRAAG
jgi:thiol-disulfide isomerase/thioredoxin